MTLEWLTNIYDPRRADAQQLYAGDSQEWGYYQQWLRDKVIGPPKASEVYTVAELQAQGTVGIYRNKKPAIADGLQEFRK